MELDALHLPWVVGSCPASKTVNLETIIWQVGLAEVFL